MPFYSTKKFGPISTGHRQWKDDGHCQYLHGYGRHVQITFGCMDLDDKTWVQDFGSLKWVKKHIEAHWDHAMLIASNDPEMELFRELHERQIIDLTVMDIEQGHSPGIEGSCKWVYDTVNPTIEVESGGRVWISKVEIWEHENNSAIFTPAMGMC